MFEIATSQSRAVIDARHHDEIAFFSSPYGGPSDGLATSHDH
jgi:hypothetical protein